MSQKRGKLIALKGLLAICLLVNNFSSFGAVIKAVTLESEHMINSDKILPEEIPSDEEVEQPDEILPEEIPSDEEVEQPDEILPEEIPSDEEVEQPEEVLADEESDESTEVLNEELLSIESRSSGSGLVQLWQVVPDGQQSKEGKTTAEIMKALQCRPNHNLYSSGGQSEHNTYVNSCYVDDALYLGEEANYYKIYLSGYEGKVPKSESHWFELDLNNDGVKVKYEVQTVAYYIPGGTTMYNLQETTDPLDVPELNYYDQYLDKYNNTDVSNERSISTLSSSTVQSPSYYANEGGILIHYVTNNVTRANSYSKVTVGKAPSWMNSGVKYYSYDGIYFYTNWRNIKVNGQGAVNHSNPFYNYYQYLPFRSKSNYSANVFDSYTNSNGGAGGKLVNTGQYFYAVQDNYGINGGLQYAMGIHESGWGKSSLSLNKNNLFGMNATDNNPYGNGTSFPSVEAGINYHADRYLSWGYTDPIDDWRYMGSHVGNKGSGMNVRYASDPFWGEKIAGWYYRFDSASGGKDYNYYTIGIKQSNAVVEVKSQPNSGSSTLYQTKNKKSNFKISNYPFLIVDEQNGYYKVKTDTPIVDGKSQFNAQYNWYNSYGYVNQNLVTVIVNNNKNYLDPHAVTTLNVDSVQMNGRIVINGWMITKGINVPTENSQKKELVILNNSNKEVLRINGMSVRRTDVTQVLGAGKYNYDYAGYSFDLRSEHIRKLPEGSYKMVIQTETDGIIQQKPFEYNKTISGSVGGVQVSLKDSVLNVVYESPRVLDTVMSDGDLVTLKGWGYLRGIELPEQNSVVKAFILVNDKGQEVYRKNAKNTLRTDVTHVTGQGLNYNYAGYELTLSADELNLPAGTYNALLEINTNGVYKTQVISGDFSPITVKGHHGLIDIYSNNKQLMVKINDYQLHLTVDDITLRDSLTISGWMITKGINVPTENSQKKELVILNNSNKEVLRINGMSVRRTDVTQVLGAGKYNYDYAGYSFDLRSEHIRKLPEGSYKMVIQTETDGIIQQKPFEYNKTISGSVGGVQVSLKDSVLNVVYESPRVLDTVMSDGDLVTLKGWGYLRGIELPEQNSVVKAFILVNDKGQEVYRKNAKNTLRTDVTHVTGQGLNYNYAGYELTLSADELNLPAGTYNALLEINTNGVYKTQAISGNIPLMSIKGDHINIGTKNQVLYFEIK